jgi:hypothetical protein
VRAELARFGAQTGLAEVVERWPNAVGESIARNAWPARIGRDGTLHVSTADSVWAFELGHRTAEIAARLGVERVRFAPGPLPVRQPEPARPGAPQPSRADTSAAAALAAPIEAENLRETVQKALGFWLARGALDRPV